MGNIKTNISTDNLISQMETVRFDLNMNPLGAPESVHRAILNNINVLNEYPDRSYKRLKESISQYCNTSADNILIGSCSYEFIKLFVEFNTPKKALLLTPGAHYYEHMLEMNGCDITYYSIPEEDDFELDIADFISHLNEDLDMVFLSNPNAATSKVIDRESLEFIAKVCKGNDIFLVVDEKYMEFVKDKDICTAIPLVEEYDNMAVLRNTSKFFAVPGLRLAYAITSNMVFKKTMEITRFPYSINKLAETVGVDMFRDASYIKDTDTLITTERNLVYSALSSRKTIKLYKPDANYILVRLLKKDITAQDVVEHCINRGLYIRSCSDITGLDNKYIRFCFMNPRQDDLLVNTILEIV
jgi:threonine-phosphate decarboxylase